MKQRGIAYKMLDNAFVQIADYAVANQLANAIDVELLHFRLDAFAKKYCPVITDLKLTYYWSIMQAEYATDLVFKNREALQAFYPHLLETLTHEKARKPLYAMRTAFHDGRPSRSASPERQAQRQRAC